MKKLKPWRSLYFSFLFVVTATAAFAEKGQSSRVLVHTLTYISHDYSNAIRDGKIIDKDEYKEEQEFGTAVLKYFNESAGAWSMEDSTTLRPVFYRLDSLIEAKAAFDVVSTIAIEARNKVIAASGLTVTPAQYPSLQNGKILFKSQCANCHGEHGYGDGPDGRILNPRPVSFYADTLMNGISPFAAFNTIRLGVEGTGMKPHEMLEDSEVWDLAFYVVALRYEKYKDNPFLKGDRARAILDSCSLDKISTSTDEELVKSFSDTANATLLLAAIRLNQPAGQTGGGFIQTSLSYLDGAMDLYKQGKFKEAAQMATLSYLEGIEPVESQIKASDPQLMSNIELQMGRLRKMMEQQRPLNEVMDSITSAKTSILLATEILGKREYSFWLALTMALSILLREGLEAFLIIMVILSILKATHLKRAVAWVHGGWILAVLLGIILWLVGGKLLENQSLNAELMEGIISLLAVGMLLYVGFWLHGKSEMDKWRDYVKRLMQGAISEGSLFGLGAISFFVVFREVFESVLFLSALDIESGGKQGHAIMFGVIAAFIIVIAFAVIVLQYSARLPIARLFRVSSFVMGVLAFVLTGKGVHALQECGILPIHGLPVFRLELIGLFPTVETCAAQLVVLAVLIAVWNLGKGKKKS